MIFECRTSVLRHKLEFCRWRKQFIHFYHFLHEIDPQSFLMTLLLFVFVVDEKLWFGPCNENLLERAIIRKFTSNSRGKYRFQICPEMSVHADLERVS